MIIVSSDAIGIGCEELIKIKGKCSDLIEGILGYKNYDEVIMKTNIGLL